MLNIVAYVVHFVSGVYSSKRSLETISNIILVIQAAEADYFSYSSDEANDTAKVDSQVDRFYIRKKTI